MKYKKFGNTGQQISVLGFGCMRLPEMEQDGKFTVDQDKTSEMLRFAAEQGVNYFDTAFHYCHDNSEIAVGEALRPIRKDVMISTKIPLAEVNEASDYRRLLETSLQKLGTDYIDFYHFWGINKQVFDDKILALDLLNEAQKAKEEGLIRHISFSFHDKSEYAKYIIDKAEIMETMLIQYNLLDRSNEEAIAYAAQKGLGVVAMGPVAGGRLAPPSNLYQKFLGKDSSATYELALKFVIGNESIACALSGMENLDMVKANTAIAASSEGMSAKEWADVAKSIDELKKFADLYCTGCNYCQSCPQKINISGIFNMYTYHNVYGLTELAKKEYQAHLQAERPSYKDCIGCGACEKRCPQKIQIREKLALADEVLSNL